MGTSLVDRWSEGELQPNWHNNIQQKQRKWVENVHTKHKPSLTAKINVNNDSIVLLVIVYWDLMMLTDPQNHLIVGIVNQKFMSSLLLLIYMYPLIQMSLGRQFLHNLFGSVFHLQILDRA